MGESHQGVRRTRRLTRHDNDEDFRIPTTNVNGATIRFEVLGNAGTWVALSPGGRRPIAAVKPIAQRIAAAGYRVLVHDRRNCGASDVLLEGEDAEGEIWADDLHALLAKLHALPAHVGGSSSGCRMALMFALRHPNAVRSLLLWRVTGGRFAAMRLAQQYYGEYLAAAQRGGMAAVCETPHFAERIAERPANRERIMNMDQQRFTAAFSRWNEQLLAGADLPVIGADAMQLAGIKVPACIVPGNDKTHPRQRGVLLQRLLPDATVHDLMGPDIDSDTAPTEAWDAKEAELSAIFVSFLKQFY